MEGGIQPVEAHQFASYSFHIPKVPAQNENNEGEKEDKIQSCKLLSENINLIDDWDTLQNKKLRNRM